jgi:Cupin-like domain
MNNLMQAGSATDQTAQIGKDLFSIVPGIEKAGTVPEVDAKSITEKEFRKEWISKNRPCLVKGAVKHWPAMEKWRDKNYWKQFENFKVIAYPHQNYNNPKYHNSNSIEMPFHEAVDRLYENRDFVFSLPSNKITPTNRFAGLIKDMPPFPFLPSPEMPRVYHNRRFFMYRRAATAWHYHDIDETLMCQVNGGKRIAILPPTIPNLEYLIKFFNDELHMEGAKLDPSLNLSPAIVDVLEGDALYIPPYWHHGVAPLDGNVGYTLAFCFRSPWHIMGDFNNYFVRDLYKRKVWPVKKPGPVYPLVGFYASLNHRMRKMTGAS